MAMLNDFCAFILTHGRADNVKTYNTLLNHGYTGPVIFVVDDEDEQAGRYIERFGVENVEIFSKDAVAMWIDRADNFNERRAIIYARNVCFEIAKKRGYKYFIELDDDYMYFSYRFDEKLNFVQTKIKDLDAVWGIMLDYYRKTPELTTIAMAQGGDYIGGGGSTIGRCIPKRKAMNSFICSTDRQFLFVGTMNDDVNTYTTEGQRGRVFLTIPIVSLNQVASQNGTGGMTDLYLSSGTYIKSFYSVMVAPGSVKIAVMGGDADKRIHHSVRWNNCVPKILREELKKL